MSDGGDDMDFCEYVYNPLMRQYQAMIRLMQTLSNSEVQQECNDIECFSPNDPNSPMNVLNSAGGGQGSGLNAYLPMLMIWALFAMALFAFRPNSIRQNKPKLKANVSNNQSNPRPRFHEHDDDDSFAA